MSDEHAARPFVLGPWRVEMRSNVPGFAARWDELFRGFPTAVDELPSVQVALTAAADGALTSTLDGATVATDPNVLVHELALTRALNERKLNAEPQLVHLHAAAVARSGKSVILAGRSGDGKSTLTARLIGQGWEYVTDEQVTFADDDSSIIPYPRPLTLRREVWNLFPGVVSAGIAADLRRVETSLLELGGVAAVGQVEPMLLLAPRYSSEQGNELLPFNDTADIVQFLASCCHDLARTRTRGCAALVHLAARVPAHHLRFNDLDSAAALVRDAAQRAPAHRPVSVARLDTAPDQTVVAGLLQRAPGSAAWFFGDGSGIAFHPDRLRLARLDTLACALWEALDTPDTVDAILADAVDDTMRAALQAWIARLAESGLLVGA